MECVITKEAAFENYFNAFFKFRDHPNLDFLGSSLLYLFHIKNEENHNLIQVFQEV